MDSDGANILQITKNTLVDNQSALLPDGRILYSRWEYVDRNFGDAHGLWTVNPDGAGQSIVYKNNTASPGAVYFGKPIAGTDKFACILSTHHGHMWGALAVIEPSRAVDGRPAVLQTWPSNVVTRLRPEDWFDCDQLGSVMPKYETPCVLDDPSTGRGSEKYFICSRMVAPPPDKPQAQSDGKSGVMGIYLVDALGNEVLLYAESPSCFSPAMLAPHTRPPAIPTRRAYDDRPGLLYVADVYQGTHMAGVKRGAAKKLRIVESPEKRGWCGGKWFGQGFQAPGMNWQDFTAKRILGTVPVESDGSAVLRGSVRHLRLFPTPGRKRPDGPVDAERHGPAGRRADRLRRVPRPAAGHTADGAQVPAAGPAARAQPHRPLVWQAADFQLRRRGPAGLRQALRLVPRPGQTRRRKTHPCR